MSSDYKKIKKFITLFNEHNDVREIIGKKILKDIKKKKKLRCACRIFDKYKLNMNEQCPNAVYTVNNMCYNCDKHNQHLGFVHTYPTKDIIKKYHTYSNQHIIPFSIKTIHLGLYKKYINQYIKIKITDYSTCSEIILFKVPIHCDDNDYEEDIGEQGKLIDRYHNFIGTYDTWSDYSVSVHDRFKNEHNHILDPKDNIPLLRYHLLKKSIYHTLTNRIYKKYRFNATKEKLYLTNDVIDN
jgi:hypothetical protein